MDNTYRDRIVAGVLIGLVILLYCYYLGQLLSGVLLSLLVIVILLVPVRDMGGPKVAKNSPAQEEFEGKVLGDSRIYEKANSFIGIPIGIVLGKIFCRYESVFTVSSKEGSIIVFYPGICPVSKGDNVRVFGEWYEGENVGIKGNFIRADEVVDESSGLVLALKSSSETKK